MNIDRIIGKMMGDASIGDEKSALDAWKKEAEENMKALADMKKISMLSDTLSGYTDFNEDEAWAAFENKLQENKDFAINKDNELPSNSNQTKTNSDSQKTSVINIKILSRVAAIAVLAFGALFLLNNQTENNTFEVREYAANQKSMSVDLLDGTEVMLDKKSKLRAKDKRKVSLKGRAFFDVARDESQQFKINLPIGEVTVLGTEFTIVADDNTTEIFVEEGSVAYKFQGTTYTLVAGEFIQVVDNTVERFAMNDDNYSSWKNDRLIFNDNTMNNVVEALSRHFGKEVRLSDPKLFKNCNVKTTFDNSSLEDILNEFSTTHGLKYKVIDNIYIVSSSDC